MLNRFVIISLLFLASSAWAQVENVPVTNPVYPFLKHMETKGLLEHYSLADLPWQRSQICDALKLISKHSTELSSAEISTLQKFLTEFEINERTDAVVFYSDSDTLQVLSSRFFSDDEKMIFHYSDSVKNITVSPLGNIDFRSKSAEENTHVMLGNLGFRMFGSIGRHFGYYLQATNGAVLSGDKELALEDHKLQQNVKFHDLNSDFDFSESHVNFQYDWFHASIGRQTRLIGPGLNQNMYISANSPAFDALTLGARFSNFEYKFMHASMLARAESISSVGIMAEIPQKYVAIHRFALRPSWGEIAFWESVIYSDRPVDLAYLNPLSFMKSLEHALRDRDNSMMGLDATIRPFRNFQIKGAFLLDDIIFGEIGTGFWSNKMAGNIAMMYSLPIAANIGIEYARVEPYTFSHFNPQNSMTNDEMLYGMYLKPNSDEIAFNMDWWWGGRYPLSIRISKVRHGENIYDEEGNLILNVGSDPFMARRPADPETGRPADAEFLDFLDGERQDSFTFMIKGGIELVRGFNLRAYYGLRQYNDDDFTHSAGIMFQFEDF